MPIADDTMSAARTRRTDRLRSWVAGIAGLALVLLLPAVTLAVEPENLGRLSHSEGYGGRSLRHLARGDLSAGYQLYRMVSPASERFRHGAHDPMIHPIYDAPVQVIRAVDAHMSFGDMGPTLRTEVKSWLRAQATVLSDLHNFLDRGSFPLDWRHTVALAEGAATCPDHIEDSVWAYVRNGWYRDGKPREQFAQPDELFTLFHSGARVALPRAEGHGSEALPHHGIVVGGLVKPLEHDGNLLDTLVLTRAASDREMPTLGLYSSDDVDLLAVPNLEEVIANPLFAEIPEMRRNSR